MLDAKPISSGIRQQARQQLEERSSISAATADVQTVSDAKPKLKAARSETSKRENTIATAKKQWAARTRNLISKRSEQAPSDCLRFWLFPPSPENKDSKSVEEYQSLGRRGKASSGYFEIRQDGEHKQLHIYGNAMDAFHNKAIQGEGLHGVVLQYTTFDQMIRCAEPEEGCPIQALESFPTLRQVTFSHNGINTLLELALITALVPKTIVSIKVTHNPVTTLELYRPWVIYSSPTVAVLDGSIVAREERSASTKLFGPIAEAGKFEPLDHLTTIALTQPTKKDTELELQRARNAAYEKWTCAALQREAVARRVEEQWPDIVEDLINELG